MRVSTHRVRLALFNSFEDYRNVAETTVAPFPSGAFNCTQFASKIDQCQPFLTRFIALGADEDFLSAALEIKTGLQDGPKISIQSRGVPTRRKTWRRCPAGRAKAKQPPGPPLKDLAVELRR